MTCTECSEHHTFMPPCEQAIPPGEVTDTVYRLLHGARENLCRAQVALPVMSWRSMLDKAVGHIDYVGARECPEQWSRFDRTDQSDDLVEAAPVHDHKGYSEEQCLRCGWVMGHPPLNCQNDNTPHVFPSQMVSAGRQRCCENGYFGDDHGCMKQDGAAQPTPASEVVGVITIEVRMGR